MHLRYAYCSFSLAVFCNPFSGDDDDGLDVPEGAECNDFCVSTVSAFYFECPEKEMYMNGSIWTKSKFMGMSIGVVMVGKSEHVCHRALMSAFWSSVE